MSCPKRLIVGFSILKGVREVFLDADGREKPSCFEGKYFDTIMAAFGADYNLKLSNEQIRLKPDGNWTGSVGSLISGEVDLVFADLVVREERMKVVDFSTGYKTSGITFVIQKVGSGSSAYNFLRVFSAEMWVSFFIVFGIFTVISYLMRNRNVSYGKNVLDLWGSVLQRGLKIDSSASQKVRLILSFWLLFAMVISCAYSASLLSFLTVPVHEKNVENFRELSEAVRKGTHRCFISESHGAIRAVLLGSDEEHIRFLGRSIEKHNWYYNGTESMESYINKTSAVIVGNTAAQLFYGPKANRPHFLISKDELSFFTIAILVRKDFRCLSKLNKIISRLSSAGIYGKLQEEFYKKSPLQDISHDSSERRLVMEHILGSQVLLCIGLTVSLIALVIEISIFKMKKWINFSRFNRVVKNQCGPGNGVSVAIRQ